MRNEKEIDGLKVTLEISDITGLKNSGCRHRNRSTGRSEPAGEARESSSS